MTSDFKTHHALLREVIQYNAGDPKRIHHFLMDCIVSQCATRRGKSVRKVKVCFVIDL